MFIYFPIVPKRIIPVVFGLMLVILLVGGIHATLPSINPAGVYLIWVTTSSWAGSHQSNPTGAILFASNSYEALVETSNPSGARLFSGNSPVPGQEDVPSNSRDLFLYSIYWSGNASLLPEEYQYLNRNGDEQINWPDVYDFIQSGR